MLHFTAPLCVPSGNVLPECVNKFYIRKGTCTVHDTSFITVLFIHVLEQKMVEAAILFLSAEFF